MRIGIAQISTPAGDLSRTGERIVEQSALAAEQGVELLVFPVATLTGPFAVPQADLSGLLMDVIGCLLQISSRVSCSCLVPVVVPVEGTATVEVFLLKDGDAVPLRFEASMRSVFGDAVQDVLDDLFVADEKTEGPASTQGNDSTGGRFASFVARGVRFVLACGFDDLYELVDYDYEMDAVVFLPEGGGTPEDSARALGAGLAESTFCQDARMCGAWLIAAGSLGCYDSTVFTGGSFVLSPAGELVAAAPSFEEALIVADVAGLGSASPSGEVGGDGDSSYAEPLELEVFDRSFFCWETLSFGLRSYVHNLGFSDVALMLDGTLGSCALAVLACDALGPRHVHALLATPLAGTSLAQSARSRGSAAWQQVVDAARRERSCRRLAANLRLELTERDARLVGVTSAVLEDAYGEPERLLAVGLEEGVARSELQTLALSSGSLMLSSCDKTWLALEARTSVAAADFLPFGDLYRTDVLELARMRNVISPVIPDLKPLACDLPWLELEEQERTSVLQRPGSLSRSAAVDLGLLHVVDVMLAGRIEWGYSVSELTETHQEEELVLAVLAQLERRATARAAAGVVLRLGGASSDELRLPYAMVWHDVARPDELPIGGEEFFETLREAALQRERDEEVSSEEAVPSDLGIPAETHHSGRSVAAPDDILGYLRDLADELGAGPGGSHGPGGHIATDGEGHFGFGGFADANPFSEN